MSSPQAANEEHPLLIRSLLIALLVFAPSVQAQDSATNDQILELLQGMKSEQEAMRLEIEALKEENAALATAAETTTEEATQAAPIQPLPESQTINRKSGWIASIHPVTDGGRSESAMLGKMIIEGFPMKHSESLRKHDIVDPIAYRGVGEIRIEEEGIHTFVMYLAVGERGENPICRFKMSIEGQEIFNETAKRAKAGTTRSWSEAIDLSAGH